MSYHEHSYRYILVTSSEAYRYLLQQVRIDHLLHAVLGRISNIKQFLRVSPIDGLPLVHNQDPGSQCNLPI